jgi:hypothetical protein
VTSNYVKDIVVPVANFADATAYDYCGLDFARDASHASDTIGSTTLVLGLRFTYRTA